MALSWVEGPARPVLVMRPRGPGDCSGSGRDEEGGGGPRCFAASRASGATAYHPHPHVMAAREAAIGNIQGGHDAPATIGPQAAGYRSQRRRLVVEPLGDALEGLVIDEEGAEGLVWPLEGL